MATNLPSNTQPTNRLSPKNIALIGVMIALIEVCKVALSFLPNIELTSFWLVMFTISFGKVVLPVIPAFILIEGVMYGFGLWWLMYLYVWPILVFFAWISRNNDSRFYFAFLSGIFGLSFGFLCSFPYFFIGLTSGGIRTGFMTAFTWWIAGIPFDLVHGIGNFILMLVLYTPIKNVIKKIKSL